MARHARIVSATFDGLPLGLAMTMRLSRSSKPAALRGDNDAFATSVQADETAVTAELRIRDTAAAESLAVGQRGVLAITVGPTEADQPARTITLTAAVLVSVELDYQQTSMATATLRFAVQAVDGQSDPFVAEDAQ